MSASPGRCAALALVSLALVAALGSALLPDLVLAVDRISVHGLAGAGFEHVVIWLAEVTLLISGAWLALITALVAGDAARGRSRARGGVPAGLRRAVLVACGAGLVGALAAPAQAGDSGGRSAVPLPEQTTAARHVSHLVALAATSEPARRTSMFVRPGDTLWDLAELTLPPGASDSRVTERWHRIHAINRHRIGPDPDLIVPGLRLVLPRPLDLREESR